ncbi:MAG TPA: DUF5312 family protein [Spirochaetales bacterium]|nr:DUF5312 family protein [Spirochaetales bacterium]
MPERTVFDGLVSELSSSERRELLQRIAAAAKVSQEPLFNAEALPSPSSPAVSRLSELGLVKRLVLFFRRLFSGKSLEELLEADELKEIAHRVDIRAPGLVDYRRGILLEGFLEELKRLRDAARFFYGVLDRSVERDKGAFFAFLGTIELPETNARLLSETDPFAFAESHPEVPEDEIRSALLGAYDEVILSIPEDRRRAMYYDLRSLLFLKRLSGFLFERLVAAWRPGASPSGGPAASFAEARGLLAELGDILYSLASPPSLELMEALFVFAERDELGRPRGDVETLVSADLAKAEEALARIRTFNAKVPLGEILRLAAEDPEVSPRALAGGEDWLLVYKAFWKERIDARVDEFREERRYRALAEEIASFVGDAGLRTFAFISREERPGVPPVRLELALSFLDGFYRGPFVSSLNRPLKIVLVDGEFYRKENRLEFTDAYDEILRLAESISALDARLGPDGDLGSSWTQAQFEVAPIAIKHRKLQTVQRNVDEEAERIVKSAGAALLELVRVIRGILKGEAGGRYDSLANLSYLDGRANKEFQKALSAAKDRCEKAHNLLAQLSGLDLGQTE